MSNSYGKLMLIGTPIGNLEDITLRAIRVLKETRILLAEDTRRISNLLQTLEIDHGEIFSLNMHNQSRKLPQILNRLKSGENVALVSDAGMPVISDPGALLVKACRDNNIEVDVIPGPSAVTTAIALSGFPGTNFSFIGFLPRGKIRRRVFRKIATGLYADGVIVFFESPYRLLETLKDLIEIIGDREVFIAREMTKLFQESLHGTVSSMIEHFKRTEPRGEFTVVLSGREIEND